MESSPEGERVGVDVAPYAEIDVPTVPPDSPARIALYEVEREEGAEPTEPMETWLQEKLEKEGRTLKIDRPPADVAPYAEFDLPTPPPDSPARIALYEVEREQGAEPEEQMESLLREKREQEDVA